MTIIPRYRPITAPTLLSAGFRPFFLLSAVWACIAVPLWLLMLAGRADIPTALPPVLWHAHEMIFGFGYATVAGFLLTAIPNWTGRMPLQGLPLATLTALWAAGRLALLLPGSLDPGVCAALDLAFPVVLLLVVAREILAGKNWRNLPVVMALGLFLCADSLVHLDSLAGVDVAMTGIRLGTATLLVLIALIGGRIIPSFTRNWLAKRQGNSAFPSPFGTIDRAALGSTVAALALWAVLPDALPTGALLLVAGLANAVRLSRWRGLATLREPLLAVLHLGYAWLVVGLLLLGASYWVTALPSTAALHASTVGAIGTMTASVMIRATLGHTGRALTAGRGIMVVFALITLAALLRTVAPLLADSYSVFLNISGVAWSCAFGLFAILFFRPLSTPRQQGGA
jgi:uncharacterized protein involved in response to NO